MIKRDIKIIILETLLEIWNDTSSYSEEGDDLLTDLMRTVKNKLEIYKDK